MKLTNIGVSGCNIFLVDNNIIRKTSPSKEYNERLVRQYEKQKTFISDVPQLTTPKTYSQGYDSGLFWFDMEYVDAKLFNEKFQQISKNELDRYIYTLLKFIEKNIIESYYSQDETKIILSNKLESLKVNSKYKELIDFILNYVHTEQLELLPQGYCHGDLTFSNILFSGECIYLIDFLDSYIESYVMDLVKIKQDVQHNWYLHLLDTDASYITRIHQIFMYIWNKIEKRHPIVNTNLFMILDVINFLRIEPYIKNEQQLNNLHRVIGDMQIYEKFNSSNDG